MYCRSWTCRKASIAHKTSVLSATHVYKYTHISFVPADTLLASLLEYCSSVSRGSVLVTQFTACWCGSVCVCVCVCVCACVCVCVDNVMLMVKATSKYGNM